jgi:integrase/recombinase XerD
MARGDAVLTHAIESYIALRRAVGFSYDKAAAQLRSFARFAAGRGDTHVHAQTAIQWARLASSRGESIRRLRSVVRFARHARAEDPRHEVPPDDVFGSPPRQRPVPFLFALADVRRLVQEARNLEVWGCRWPLTLSALFALLAATGLRLGEALRLRFGDLTADGLTIRETKFRKSRLVPLHPTAVAGIERYLVERRKAGGDDDHLFVGQFGRKLNRYVVGEAFRLLVRRLGLKPTRSDLPRPRIHSLRHTFAVRALESCPHDRNQVGRHLLALSTYLGHATVASTYWYLQATPQLLTDIASACEDFLKGEAR